MGGYRFGEKNHVAGGFPVTIFSFVSRPRNKVTYRLDEVWFARAWLENWR
jgi:hypothetical protein